MTNKPIIIDNVDVSECIHRKRKNEHCTHCNAYSSKVFDFDCSDFPNCYYKQLKRLENEYEGFSVKYTDMEMALKTKTEECEKLKEELESFYDDCKGCSTCLEAQNNAREYRDLLQAEKEKVKELHKVIGYLDTAEYFINENGTLYSRTEYKYIKALKQIKEIADIINDRTMVASYICDHLDKILQKISEVIKDEKI